MRYIADLESLLDGSLRDAVLSGRIVGELLIPSEYVEFLEEATRRGNALGLIGLSELASIRTAITKLGLDDTVKLVIKPIGSRARSIEGLQISAREYAREHGYALVTSDPITRRAAEAVGIRTIYIGRDQPRLGIEKFFDEGVMSVHLKEGVPPILKVGRPGEWRAVYASNKPMTREELETLVRELTSRALRNSDAKLEIKRDNSLVIQYRDIRVVVVMPPLSERIEITAVKPIVRKSLSEYNLDRRLVERVEKQAEGILIAGPPGAGKSTFAAALAEFYASRGKIVKTVESPRDMVLGPHITQLSKTHASSEEIHDILLLSRPDYVIFDEMRDTADFQLYVDLRLAGIGMVGVVHATAPIDAIQRFIGRVELGMIPSIVDTVIFMRSGEVAKVYALAMEVKVPYGLREEDLARPVIVVRDFFTGDVEYEIYVFGEETFVVPVRREREYRVVDRRIRSLIISTLKRYVPPNEIVVGFDSENNAVVIKVPEEYLGIVMSRGISKLEKIRRKYDVDVRVEPL